MPTKQRVLRLHRPVVDPHIVDQAGPERAWGKLAAGPDPRTAERAHQARLCILGDFNTIGIEDAVGTVPHKTHAVPATICDDAL